MTVFDWGFIGLLSLAAVSLILSLWLIFLWLSGNRKYRQLSAKPPKNKKKRKRYRRQLQQLNKQKKSYRFWGILLAVVAIISISLSSYGRYYQATNLSEADATNIANAYRYMYQIEQQFPALEDDPETVKAKLGEVSRNLSSYGNRRASNSLSEDGQLLLNRYYKRLAQLGQNLNSNLRILTQDASI